MRYKFSPMFLISRITDTLERMKEILRDTGSPKAIGSIECALLDLAEVQDYIITLQERINAGQGGLSIAAGSSAGEGSGGGNQTGLPERMTFSFSGAASGEGKGAGGGSVIPISPPFTLPHGVQNLSVHVWLGKYKAHDPEINLLVDMMEEELPQGIIFSCTLLRKMLGAVLSVVAEMEPKNGR